LACIARRTATFRAADWLAEAVLTDVGITGSRETEEMKNDSRDAVGLRESSAQEPPIEAGD